MRKSSMAAAAAATLVLAQSASPLLAAPDNTLGMALMFAVVNADGTLARGSGAVSSTKLPGSGQYQVDFDRDVAACAYLGIIGNPGAGTPPTGQISVALRATSSSAIFVLTNDSAGSTADRQFHLLVYCAR